MNQAKIILTFNKFSDDRLETKAESILLMLTGNPFFPSPVPPLTALSTALDAYKLALVAAQSKDKAKVATKRACRTALEAVMLKLGRYVTYEADGDEEKLVSSGYDLAKQPEPSVLQEPGVVTVSQGISSGRLVASLKRVVGAYGYLYQITPDPLLPESNWESMPLNRSTAIFENLTPGQKYWIRVAAVGSGSQIAYTGVTSQIVL
jgi:hypothetical protein